MELCINSFVLLFFSKQNWHPGPIGFEMIMDSMLHYYSVALSQAILKIQAQINKNNPKSTEEAYSLLTKKFKVTNYKENLNKRVSNIPIIEVDCDEKREFTTIENNICNLDSTTSFKTIECYSGFNPIYGERMSEISSVITTPEEELDWVYKLKKSNSKIGSCSDPTFKANNDFYRDKPECSAHPDVGYVYEANNKKQKTRAIEIKWPKNSHKVVEVCARAHKFVDFLKDFEIKIGPMTFNIQDFEQIESCVALSIPLDLQVADKLEINYVGDHGADFIFVVFT